VRLLLTNDDGIRSPGLHALARHLHGAGHDVVVAAPQEDMSGSSAAIGRLHADEHIDVKRVPIPDADGLEGYAIAGPPGLAAMAGRLGAFGAAPDLVVSGVNAGLNTGHSVLHSGTVGATLTAQNFGGSGLAVSIEATDPWFWETACEYAAAAITWMADNAPPCTVVNLNVPGRARDDVRGLRWAKLDRFGSVRAATADARNGLQIEFKTPRHELDDDSDIALVSAGYATLTTIVGVSETSVETRDRGVPCTDVARTVEHVPPSPDIAVPTQPLHLTGAT
jgi:5'-nucleotidase